ncbi:MAG: riboflavin synthase [Erysipelotrichaceae bacterium]
MFTGLVEEIGTIKSIVKNAKSARITIQAKVVLDGLKIGDSINTNGTCLTVTDFGSSWFTVDVMAETMRRSNLNNIKNDHEVNLERALRLGDRLGGHIVSGHVDGLGTISQIDYEENATWLTIMTINTISRYIIYKGSIAIDGVSLTVASVDSRTFKVSIIPHTNAMTSLHRKRVGDLVNLECDMVGKYIEKFLLQRVDDSTSNKLDENFLRENGFM